MMIGMKRSKTITKTKVNLISLEIQRHITCCSFFLSAKLLVMERGSRGNDNLSTIKTKTIRKKIN